MLIVAALILLALVAYGGYSCVHSAGGGSSFTDNVSHYPAGSVTFLARGHTYLVHQPDGSFLALSDAEANDADRISGCLIRYRPDLTAAGETGVFADDCHGVLFNRAGVAVQGSSPPMQGHTISVSDGTVTIHFKDCVAANGTQREPCRM